MTDALRPCPSCGRHYRDEDACPFCGARGFRMPAVPTWLEGDYRPAPKYGGPPLRRALRLIVLLAVVGGVVAAVAAAVALLTR